MQKSRYLVYSLMFLLSLTINGSCQAQTDNNKSSKGSISETRNVTKFSEIDLMISANVELKQGSPQKLVLEGDADDLEKVVTEVSGSELKIRTRPGSWNINRIKVYITMEDIESINISGSGSIKAEPGVKTSNLELVVSGSGNINVPELSVQRISSVISGSGNISYSGNTVANESKLVVTGSGNIDAAGLMTNNSKVTITGSGDCNVAANEKLDVQITGSGSVYYKGKALIDANVTGSGKVRQSN